MTEETADQEGTCDVNNCEQVPAGVFGVEVVSSSCWNGLRGMVSEPSHCCSNQIELNGQNGCNLFKKPGSIYDN